MLSQWAAYRRDRPLLADCVEKVGHPKLHHH